MTIDSYKLYYEDLPPHKTRKGGKTKMTKNTNKQAPTIYNKTRGEHIKDMVIVALIVTIVSFIGGVQFQKDQQQAIVNAVAQSVQSSQPVKK